MKCRSSRLPAIEQAQSGLTDSALRSVFMDSEVVVLLRNGALTAARVALKHVEFHVQYGLAVAQVAALAVKSGKSALRQIRSQKALSVGLQMNDEETEKTFSSR